MSLMAPSYSSVIFPLNFPLQVKQVCHCLFCRVLVFLESWSSSRVHHLSDVIFHDKVFILFNLFKKQILPFRVEKLRTLRCFSYVFINFIGFVTCFLTGLRILNICLLTSIITSKFLIKFLPRMNWLTKKLM